MAVLYIFDLGSTKSNVASIRKGDTEDTCQIDTLSGFNPNRLSTDFFEEVKNKLPIQSTDKVIIYGSGLANQENQTIVIEAFECLFKVRPKVWDDIIGTARASLGNQPGIIAIMGTGACVAQYNGQSIVKRSGGYGYLIDDVGGGLELGKVIVSNWLSNRFPEEVNKAIQNQLKIQPENFTKAFYESPNLEIIASLAKVAHSFNTTHEIQTLLVDYFELFFKRHVLPFVEENKQTTIYCVGSIAQNFQEVLKKVAKHYGIFIGGIERYPIKRLIRFHLAKAKKANSKNT